MAISLLGKSAIIGIRASGIFLLWRDALWSRKMPHDARPLDKIAVANREAVRRGVPEILGTGYFIRAVVARFKHGCPRNLILSANVRDHRHRTAGAPDADIKENA